MPSRYETRALAKALWYRGIQNPYTLYKVWHIPYMTALRYIRRLRCGQSLDDLPRSGRPLLRTSKLRRQLGQIKSRYPKESAAFYARQLSKLNRRRISTTTAWRTLRDLGYRWRLRPRRKLTPSQKQIRFGFARARLEDSWERRWFFDESYFNLYRHSKKFYLKVETDDAMSLSKLSEKQEKVSVGVALAISRGRKSALAFLPKNWLASDLVEVWENTLFPSLGWSNRLAHQNELVIDNDGRHFSPAWKDYEEGSRLRPLRPWPANSPDLNCVENVFAWLKDKVESMEPRDEPSLREAITAAWQAFPAEMTRTLVDSTSHRLAEVIRLEGGRTKY